MVFLADARSCGCRRTRLGQQQGLGQQQRHTAAAAPITTMTAHLPSFSTGANLLDAFCQSHHKPLSAFGDLTDNARDADAKQLSIDVERCDPESDLEYRLSITITDDGANYTPVYSSN